jgi:hypothetical protein
VRNRPTEGASLRAFWVHVNPLVVARRLGEKIDFLLSNSLVLGVTQMGSDKTLESFNAVDLRNHKYLHHDLTGVA